MVNLDTAVHYNNLAVLLGKLSSIMIYDTLLHPDTLAVKLNSLFNNWTDIFSFSEYIYDVYMFRNIQERRVTFLPKNFLIGSLI